MMFNEPGPYNYATSMDREYIGNASPEFVSGYSGGSDISRPINSPAEAPILTTGQIGQTIAEGRGEGSFIESMQAAIRKGAGSVELSLSAAGQEPNVGPDLYTKDKRREIKEIARANQITIASVHTPVQVVANVSGFAGPERGFMDEHRHIQVTEVRKAIHFAAETTNGAAVVVHTGEFQRPFHIQPWAKDPKTGELIFKAYDEEPERFNAYLVDDRTGRVIGEAKRTQVVFEPVYKTAQSEGLAGKYDSKKHAPLEADDLIDIKGEWVNPEDPNSLFERVPEWDASRTRFKTERRTWEYFEDRAKKWNDRHADEIAHDPDAAKTPEEMFWQLQMETQALQYRGSSLFHGQYYEHHKNERDQLMKALEYYKQLEENMPEEEVWKIMKQDYQVGGAAGQLVTGEFKKPTEIIKKAIEQATHNMRYTHEASASSDAQADRIVEDLEHVKAVHKYAKEQTSKSYAELGITAMDETNNRQLKNPVFVAPENIFPEHGYGSHPEELITLVQDARKKMAEELMAKRGFGETKAMHMAEMHIKATLDTEHIGMWKKHYVRKEGESEEEFTKRFNGWYMEQVVKLEKSGIIGHIHIADGFGYGHANLPAGQGTMPVVDAVTYLKKKGYTGAYLSEGYGDATRMLRDTWKAFGSPIYSVVGPAGHMAPGGPVRWSDVQHSYFGQTFPPNYIFGAYSPSNDWTLWSQVPME